MWPEALLLPLAAVVLLNAAPARAICPGDCDRDARVTVDELTRAAAIALDPDSLGDCSRADSNRDLSVDAAELTLAITAATRGCAATSEDVSLLGVYDVIATYRYDTHSKRRTGVGVAVIDHAGQVELEIDFDAFTSAIFRLRSTAPETVRFDGHGLEQGDLAQMMSGFASKSGTSSQTSLAGTVRAQFGPFFGLSHAIDLKLTRLNRDYTGRLVGLWKFELDSAGLEAFIPIRPDANGVGSCGPADMTDSSGTIVHRLEEAPCYFTGARGFLYRGPLVTLRGGLANSYQFTFGVGTWAVGFGIGTSQTGEWTATRVEIGAERD